MSTVIPGYNEKDTIEKVVEFVGNAPLNTKDIIVVDDCLQDGTQTCFVRRFQRMVDQIYLSSDKPMEVGRPCAATSPEITAKLAHRGCRFYEVGIGWRTVAASALWISWLGGS